MWWFNLHDFVFNMSCDVVLSVGHFNYSDHKTTFLFRSYNASFVMSVQRCFSSDLWVLIGVEETPVRLKRWSVSPAGACGKRAAFLIVFKGRRAFEAAEGLPFWWSSDPSYKMDLSFRWRRQKLTEALKFGVVPQAAGRRKKRDTQKPIEMVQRTLSWHDALASAVSVIHSTELYNVLVDIRNRASS